MAALRVCVANCPIDGEIMSALPTGGSQRDRIDLALSGFNVSLRQTKDGLPGRHQAGKGRTTHTTTLEFGEVSVTRRARAERIADDLAWILSFATMSPVRPFLYQFGDESRGHRITSGMLLFRPTIDTMDARIVRTFVHSTWPNFRRLKRRRKLAAIFDYLTIAERPGQPIEVSTLLALTALESLKSTHSPGRRGEFKKRVDRMLREVGMRRGLCQLTKLRNQLVHEGLASVSFSTLRNHHDRLHDILREYLLRLLGYRGSYLLYSKESRISRVL